MIKDIIKYPTTPSLEFGTNVRHFDKSLLDLIQDLKDTIDANSLGALAAFQIGSPLAVVIIKKDDGSYLELINPCIIKKEGTIVSTESTAYFPNLTSKIKRYSKIKLMYDDTDAQQQFLEASDELAILIQRKIDYIFGSTFYLRLDNEEKILFDSKLEYGTDAITNNGCPTIFKRDKILHLIRFLAIAVILGLFSNIFISDDMVSTVATIENYIMSTMLGLIIIYFFYAQYEGREYKNCSSCQIGNIIGTSIIELTKLSILFALSYGINSFL